MAKVRHWRFGPLAATPRPARNGTKSTATQGKASRKNGTKPVAAASRKPPIEEVTVKETVVAQAATQVPARDPASAGRPVQELKSAPNLLQLFGKAALGNFTRRKGGGAKALPDSAYQRSDVVIDQEHLAAYDKVCEFRLSDELPITYPHMLAFPLQVKLMTDERFPFPMIGLVHVANRITQIRPLLATEKPTIVVHAENLRPHDKGTQFDVVSEALIDGRPVWTDVSTYLKRGGSGGSGEKSEKPDERPSAPEPSAIWRVPADIGRRYAHVSGDHNPIHLHPLTAKAFGFPTAIAHGMWTKARCLAAFEGRLPGAYAVDVRFKLPVLLPAKLGFVAESTKDGYTFQLFDARKGKPHLEGTITTG